MDASVNQVFIKTPQPETNTPKFKVFTRTQLHKISQFMKLPEEARNSVAAASAVFPFRVNEYVVNELIDWGNWKTDPIFRLLFPQKEMLQPSHYSELTEALAGSDLNKTKATINEIRSSLNSHPAGQMELNVPTLDGAPIDGIQHKYKETVLFFPKQGQTCHSYCTFCFRWAQFIGDKSLQFASKEAQGLVRYLQKHKEVSDVPRRSGSRTY